MFMRRAIGVAMALLFSLPLLAGTISSIDPASIKALSGEYFMTASGSGFAETDEFIFDGPAGHFELTVNAIDRLGAITGWVPLPIVNTPGTYTLAVRSWNGTSAPVSFTVLKSGGRLPLQLHLPELITVLARSSLGTGIKYDVTTTGGDGTAVTISCDPASGSTFPFGSSKISCVAYNASERDSSTTFVNVFDGTAPKISVPADFEMAADDEKGAYVKFDASAVDDIDGALRVTCDHDSGTFIPNGYTTINCEADDFSLNPAYGKFRVFVKPFDPGKLQIVVPDGVKAEAPDKYGTHVSFDVSAIGSADPDPVIDCFPASGSYFNVGDTKVGCTATDDFGARSVGSFVVTVVEGSSFLRSEDIAAEATSPGGAEVSWEQKAPEDWTSAIVCSPSSGSLFAFGETSVECSSTDAAGEKVSGTFKVTVADTTAPHIANVRAVVGETDAERHVVPVSIDVETIDAGDAAPRCVVDTLTSDSAVDWHATSELALEIRSEAGAPRSFRVQVTCVDGSGNRATTSIPLAITKGRPAKVQ
jgi:hypothetical protein